MSVCVGVGGGGVSCPVTNFQLFLKVNLIIHDSGVSLQWALGPHDHHASIIEAQGSKFAV